MPIPGQAQLILLGLGHMLVDWGMARGWLVKIVWAQMNQLCFMWYFRPRQLAGTCSQDSGGNPKELALLRCRLRTETTDFHLFSKVGEKTVPLDWGYMNSQWKEWVLVLKIFRWAFGPVSLIEYVKLKNFNYMAESHYVSKVLLNQKF